MGRCFESIIGDMMTEKPLILIVDDDPAIRLTLETGLSLKGFRTKSAFSGRLAIEMLGADEFDGIICDLVMPDGDGLSVVRGLRESDSDLPIILMTAQGSVETAFESIGEGASDFIAKPFEIAALANLMQKHLDARSEREQAFVVDQEIPIDPSTSGLIGRSPAMVAVFKLIAFAARTSATVLITGESGTGKELVARAIHDLSERAGRKFISVNCSGLTDTLLEAELFGHERGAFTGASGARAGLFEAADGGTIFLDELASTSPGFQASLLRVLQTGEIRRVGSTQTRRIDARTIGASNENLNDFVDDKKFRADLFYRLSVLTIDLPPLRHRMSDVPILTRHFLSRLKSNAESEIHISQEVWTALENYDFPGNVRELENALTHASMFSTGNMVTVDCLPPAISGTGKIRAEHFVESENDVLDLAGDRPDIDELQRRYLNLVLAEVGGNRRRAADILGVNRRTIQRLITRYGLNGSAETDDEDTNFASGAS